jgi:hypothetical protein
MQEQGKLVWLKVDVARDVLEPLGAEVSLTLGSPERGSALAFV